MMLGIKMLKHRRIEQSLIIFCKCFKENGPCYIIAYKPRVTQYNLRNCGLNVAQSSYKSRLFNGPY